MGTRGVKMADANVSFKNFMLNWFKAYHLANMDEPRRERWKDLRGKKYEDVLDDNGNLVKRIWLDDKRTDGQKGWGDKEGNLNTTLPEPELSEEDWEKFYTICRDTIRNINSKREDLRRAAPDAPFPIDKWFATKDDEAEYKPFSSQTIDENLKNKFKNLGDLIVKSVDLQQLLEPNFNDDYSFGTFVKELQSGNYSEHPQQIIQHLQRTLGHLRQNLNLNFQNKLDNIQSETVDKLLSTFGLNARSDDLATKCEQLQNHLNKLYSEIDPENEKINKHQLNQFKDPHVYQEILKALYASDKEGKKSAFYNQFASNGGSQITGWMSESVDGNNYESGANVLIPKFEDELNIKETWNKKISDFNDEHFKRFADRASRHIYVEPKAKTVVDAILKEKLSSKDGLSKILEKKDSIIKCVKAKDPSAGKGVDFLFEALEYINNSGDMDKAFEGALRNGRKMEAIAFEIIKYALNKGKVAEAKVALETLAVMRYDTFTSAHWDKVKEANKNLSIFGSKDLSWNKNEGVQFVTNALDKTIGFGINAIFWAAVITRNKIQHARGKISGADHFRFANELVNLQNKAANFDTLDSANAELQAAEQEKSTQEHDIGISVHDWDERHSLEQEAKNIQQKIDPIEKDIEDLNKEIKKYEYSLHKLSGKKDQKSQQAIESLNENINYLSQQIKNKEADKNSLSNNKKDIGAKIAKITQDIQSRGQVVNSGKTHIGEINRLDAIQNDIERLEKETSDLQNEIARLQTGLPGTQVRLDQKNQKLAQKQNELQRKEQEKETDFISKQKSYDASVKRYRVAKELQSRLQSKADKDKKEVTDSKPYSAPKNPMENLDMLIYFWNTVNGYEDISVESYNFFRSIKDQRKEINLGLLFEKKFEDRRS